MKFWFGYGLGSPSAAHTRFSQTLRLQESSQRQANACTDEMFSPEMLSPQTGLRGTRGARTMSRRCGRARCRAVACFFLSPTGARHGHDGHSPAAADTAVDPSGRAAPRPPPLGANGRKED